MSARSAAILLLIVVLVLHLVEEVKAGFRKKLPVGEMPLPLFIVLNVLIYGFCFTTLVLSVRDSGCAVPLAWVLAIVMLLNGLGHLGVMMVKKAYFPGGGTAVLLVAASAYLILLLGVL